MNGARRLDSPAAGPVRWRRESPRGSNLYLLLSDGHMAVAVEVFAAHEVTY
jgi:hypothetical protein